MSTNDNDILLAAALSALFGKEILDESNVPQDSEKNIKKISLFDQHLALFIYGKIGTDDSPQNKSLITLDITVLETRTSFSCIIEHDASVDKLKQIIYEKTGIQCHRQNLVYRGREINEGHRLNEYGIEDSNTIFLTDLKIGNTNDVFIMDNNSRYQRFDYDFTNVKDTGKRFIRGGLTYHRPCGWKRFAINVADKYENIHWLGAHNKANEWPVSYHGIGHNTGKSIGEIGYDLTQHKRFIHSHGIYSTPDIHIAERYAKTFIHNGEEYLVILQNRVNPRTLIRLLPSETKIGEYWISPNAADIRPYAICIKKKS